MNNAHIEDNPDFALGRWPLLITVVAALLSVFQLWQPVAGFVPPGALPFESILGMQPAVYFRPVHLCWILCLGFWVYPLRVRGVPLKWLDGLTTLLVLWASWRIVQFDYSSIDHLLHGLEAVDFVAGIIIVLATLELARRSVGMVMCAIGVVFILYAAFGNVLPDVLATRGFSFERIVRFQVYTGAGLYGAPIGIAAGAVFSFVLFGAFLQVTGAGKMLIDLSFAAAGKSRGGPAKASVMAFCGHGVDFWQRYCQYGDHRFPDHSDDEKARLQTAPGCRHRGGGLYRRADHAADYGSRCFRYGGVHQNPLRRHCLDGSGAGAVVLHLGAAVRAPNGHQGGFCWRQ